MQVKIVMMIISAVLEHNKVPANVRKEIMEAIEVLLNWKMGE